MECELVSSPNWAAWANTATAVLVAVIAGIGAWIARQQSKTNQKRLKHELFDRRYEMYQAVTTFLGDIGQDGTCSHQRSIQYLRDTKGVEFLFGADIKEYVDSLYSRSTNLTLHTTMNEAEQEMEDVRWFAAQLTAASEKFSPYLKLDH